MSFTCFDKFKRVLDGIPDEGDRKTMALAIIEYGLTGADPGFCYPLSAIFEAVREDIDNSRDARENNQGGRPRGSKPKRKATAAPPADAGEVSAAGENGGSENQKPPFSEGGTPVSENGNQSQSKPGQTIPCQDNPLPPSEGSFAVMCLGALNEELGRDYTHLPAPCARTLRQAQGRHTVEEVRAMVAYKRDEWRGTQFAKALTPNTLFSPDHFEQYMAQAAGHREEESRYAAYD